MSLLDEPRTDWHDAARIAVITGVDVQQVRYHWRKAWRDLDLPPLATGFIDSERAGRLIRYLRSNRRRRRSGR